MVIGLGNLVMFVEHFRNFSKFKGIFDTSTKLKDIFIILPIIYNTLFNTYFNLIKMN